MKRKHKLKKKMFWKWNVVPTFYIEKKKTKTKHIFPKNVPQLEA